MGDAPKMFHSLRGVVVGEPEKQQWYNDTAVSWPVHGTVAQTLVVETWARYRTVLRAETNPADRQLGARGNR